MIIRRNLDCGILIRTCVRKTHQNFFVVRYCITIFTCKTGKKQKKQEIGREGGGGGGVEPERSDSQSQTRVNMGYVTELEVQRTSDRRT